MKFPYSCPTSTSHLLSLILSTGGVYSSSYPYVLASIVVSLESRVIHSIQTTCNVVTRLLLGWVYLKSTQNWTQ